MIKQLFLGGKSLINDTNIAWVASFVSLVGIFLSINKNVLCWPVWTFANMFWIYLSIKKKDKPQLILWSVYTIVNLYGWYSWLS